MATPEDAPIVSGILRQSFADDPVHIRGMAVLPAARTIGVGSDLLAHMESWALEQACSRLFLSTTPFLHTAIRMYERFGFRQNDQGSHDLFGTPLFTMEKRIVRA